MPEKFEGEFEKRFEREKPAMSFDIFYLAHATDKDMKKGLEKRFADSDIYIPELYGWSAETIKGFRDVSAGKMKPEDFLDKRGLSPENFKYYSALLEQLKMICDSRKPIIFIDVPKESYIRVRGDRAEINLDEFSYSFGKKFGANLKIYKKLLEECGFIERAREEYMISRVKPALDKILEENPELKNKKEIRVLLSLGAFHTGVWHMLKKEKNKQKVSAGFSALPLYFKFLAEAQRKYRFGREVDDELAARAMMEQELHWWVSSLPVEDTLTKHRYIREVISRFDYKEIKEMFEQSQNGDDFLSLFEEKLTEKKIQAPESGN